MRLLYMKNSSGSVLMEYVILVMLIGAPLVVFMQAGFYNFNEGLTAGTGSIDLFGVTVEIKTPGIIFKHYFQRILTGISLPIP